MEGRGLRPVSTPPSWLAQDGHPKGCLGISTRRHPDQQPSWWGQRQQAEVVGQEELAISPGKGLVRKGSAHTERVAVPPRGAPLPQPLSLGLQSGGHLATPGGRVSLSLWPSDLFAFS